jgi:hypothetical protein
MKCITSPALDDTKIMSYVEGEADDAVVAHMRECPYCSERANRWTLLQNDLKKRLHRVSCPTPMELGDYHLGLLPAPQALIVAQHIRGCPLCAREVVELEDFLAEPAMNETFLGTARRLVARLVDGEDGLTPSSVALRGEIKGPLTLEAEGVVVILDLQPVEGEMITILGQLAADDQDRWTGARVEFYQGDQLEFSTTVDDLGAFQVEGIMPGAKELQITTKDNSLTVESNFEVLT